MLGLIVWFFLTVSPHVLYLSTSKMVLTENQNELEIQIKVFSDDLQAALINHFNEKEISNIADIGFKNIPEIKTYFKQHLILHKVNSKNKWAMNLEEITADYQETIYLLTAVYKDTLKRTEKAQILEIQGDYLMEVFPTQSNMVHLSFGEQRFFLRLKKNKSKEEVVLGIK